MVLLDIHQGGDSLCAQYPIVLVPGSPHGIFTLMQDIHSAFWMGTIDHVLRFDGEHFYSLRSYGFPRKTPNSFAEDSDGGIWIATQGTDANGDTGHGGLYRYQSGRVEKVFSGDGMTIVRWSRTGEPTFFPWTIAHGYGRQ